MFSQKQHKRIPKGRANVAPKGKRAEKARQHRRTIPPHALMSAIRCAEKLSHPAPAPDPPLEEEVKAAEEPAWTAMLYDAETPPESSSETMLRSILSMSGSSERVWRLPMAYTTLIVSSAAGLISTYASNDPTVAPAWASYALVFNQYRVRKVKAHVVPMYISTYAAVNFQQVLSYLDRDNATTGPANYQDALQHADTLAVGSGYNMHVRTLACLANAENPQDTWNDTAAPAAGNESIKFVGFTSLLSTVVWNLTIEWEVEFQGLGA